MAQSVTMTRLTPLRLTTLSIVAVLVLAACGSATPSATPSGAPPASLAPTATAGPSASSAPSGDAEVDALYDAIEAQVLALRGLEPATVARETIDEERLKELSASDFDTDNPAEYVAANERLYKALGLLEEDASLRDVYLELIGSQVAGFYRPDDKKLYVVSRSGAVNGADKITFAHEYDHALQDANFDVFGDPEALRDKSDEALARAALYEGDATMLMSLWAIPNLTPAEFQEVLAAGTDPESTAILERTPPILSETLLFPYNAGVAFLQPIQMTGGWDAVDAIYTDLPKSTEQILHPEKYTAKEAPLVVDLPDDLATRMGEGWTQALEDTWGEFQTGVWFRQRGVPAAEATSAAAGWGGDRLAVLQGPDGAWAVVLSTTWDTAADADEFAAAAQTAVGDLGHPAIVTPNGDTNVLVTIASDDAALSALGTAVLGAGAGG